MDSGSLDVLHDSWDEYVLSVTDCVNLKLGSLHVFVNQHRILNALCQNDFHVFLYVRVVESDDHVLSAKHVGRTQQHRVLNFVRSLQSLLQSENCKSLRLVDSKLVAQFLKSLAVLGKVNGIRGCSQNPDALLVQEFRELDCGLSSESDHHADRIFRVDYVHHILRGKRLEVKPVARVKVSGDGLRVVVDCDDLISEFFQSPHALYARIVELNSLSDSDWTASQNDDRTL